MSIHNALIVTIAYPHEAPDVFARDTLASEKWTRYAFTHRENKPRLLHMAYVSTKDVEAAVARVPSSYVTAHKC